MEQNNKGSSSVFNSILLASSNYGGARSDFGYYCAEVIALGLRVLGVGGGPGGARQRTAQHMTLWTPIGPRKYPPPPRVWAGPLRTHPYIVIGPTKQTQIRCKRYELGYSSRGFFLEPPAEDADSALERLSFVTEPVPSGKSSEPIKLFRSRYDFIASRSTFINSISTREIWICARNSRGSSSPGCFSAMCVNALYFQIKCVPLGESQKGQAMGMFVHGDDFVGSFAVS